MTPPRWIVDDGPVNDLASVIDPATVSTWPAGELLVAEATDRAGDQSLPRRALLDARADGRRVFEPLGVPMNSPAAEVLFAHLRVGPRSAQSGNLAEDQAIALAITTHHDAMLVLREKRAALTALAELGPGRVAHAFDLWIYLRDHARITQTDFDRLCQATKAADQGLPGIPWRIKKSPAP